jgi:hypothetical protein
MNVFRDLSQQEKALLVALLQSNPELVPLIRSLEDLVVEEMRDGGMGSLSLVPKGLEGTRRSFGKQLVLGDFTDTDGVSVSVTVNVDSKGTLYELDVWKVNFTSLLKWPDPSAVRIVR